jgi:hypothetical protein
VTPRTKLQAEADSVDCDVFRLIWRLERLYDANRQNDRAQEKIHRALEQLRGARPHIRSLMSNEDRARS